MAASRAVYSIAPELPFLDALAAGLLDRAKGDPLELARMTVLLPTRRASRSLGEAFLRQGRGRPLLLPRMMPVGDLDAEELALLSGESESSMGDSAADIPPAIPETTRRLKLARLVLAWGKSSGFEAMSAAQAAPLAAELARFLDEAATEGCDFAKLKDLAPERHAEHWQQVLRFLAIVTEYWPKELAALGALDPASRRNEVLRRQAEAWTKSPPAHPVISAGITGSVPAVAQLIKVVAGLPRGMVVLPGLDRSADAETWDAVIIDPTHPQHLLARLLALLEVSPKQVKPWNAPGISGGPASRAALIKESLRPADVSHRWGAISGINENSLAGLLRVDCPGPQEEATVVALLLRQKLETPGATAALVTPDRDLARRVASELKRWGISIDDSAGAPLSSTPPGLFLRLVLEAAAENLAPLPLLALLKHPLASGGIPRAEFRDLARQLELAALRGPRPAPGLEGLAAAVSDKDLKDFVSRLGRALSPLIALLQSRGADLSTLVKAHVEAAEALAKTGAKTGEETAAENLWRGEAGEAASLHVRSLLEAAPGFPPLDGSDYPALFEALLAGSVVRPAYGRHPRLFIWGLLEARLQQADLLVLGGLNEGAWPKTAEGDPWLSRPMRRDFGLPPPERRIGASAHDFAQCLGSPEVVLTRAARVEGAPTVPSRWLLRLETVLRAVKLEEKLRAGGAKDGAPLAWQNLLDDPGKHRPLPPPSPAPPLAARPRQLSVTSVETWIRDPYAIYARHILRLRPFDPIDQDPGAAERGVFVHAALDRFLKTYPGELPPDAEARLLRIGREEFGRSLDRASLREFWWPRFERVAAWLVDYERERRPLIAQSFSEIAGKLVLPATGGAFTLTAKADRIDRMKDGGLAILDYKTGALPPPGEVKSGYAPQLPLEAAIAGAGGFPGLAKAAVTELLYWKLSGGDPAGEERPASKDALSIAALASGALSGLGKLVARFDDPKTPYRSLPQPEKAPRYSDYTHLARVKEWLLGAGTES
jgi:ATP-dependent helicase/nuclease subunit B